MFGVQSSDFLVNPWVNPQIVQDFINPWIYPDLSENLQFFLIFQSIYIHSKFSDLGFLKLNPEIYSLNLCVLHNLSLNYFERINLIHIMG